MVKPVTELDLTVILDKCSEKWTCHENTVLFKRSLSASLRQDEANLRLNFSSDVEIAPKQWQILRFRIFQMDIGFHTTISICQASVFELVRSVDLKEFKVTISRSSNVIDKLTSKTPKTGTAENCTDLVMPLYSFASGKNSHW